MDRQLAHVSYILPREVQIESRGSDNAFLLSPLHHVGDVLLLLAAVALVALLHIAEVKIPWLSEKVKFFRGRGRTYQEFLPWILRVALGIALIGAGATHHLISPAVVGTEALGFLQMAIGFLLLIGFLVTPAIFLALALSLFALVSHPMLIENFELPAAIVAFILLAQSKPGVDDLFGILPIPFPEHIKKYFPTVLRLGLGVSFIFMALHDKILNPHLFGTVAQMYLSPLMALSPAMWTLSAGLTELTLGIAILLGFHTRFASAACFFLLSVFFFVFQEEVIAHVTLFATLAVLAVSGAGPLSLDSWYAQRKNA